MFSVSLFAGAAAQVFQFGLPHFGLLAFGFADEESATSNVLCFVKLIFCQVCSLRRDELKFHCNARMLPMGRPWDYLNRCLGA
jgi:hypothetical protein